MTASTMAGQGWTRRMLPNVTVFLASGAIMVVELSAGALASRHIGMSLYTWTAIIGVMMTGMAAGNWVGGRLADRFRPERALALHFLLAAAGCVLLLPLNQFFGGLPAFAALSWPVRILLHTLCVFLLPGVALGAVTPVAARLALRDNARQGRAVGTVFAWSVAGSIIGTALTGYWLLYAFRVSVIMLLSAGVLAALGLGFALLRGRQDTQPAASPATPESAVPPIRGLTLALAYLTVFTSNAAFMTLEMAGARIIARQFGSSVYTWTAVIGVFLAGITLGNYIGGRLADRNASARLLSRAFLAASITTLVGLWAGKHMGRLLEESIHLAPLSWPLQILLFALSAFFVPSVCLGLISPIVVKRLLLGGRLPGGSVGSVYAWGSLGAIAGTLASGYFLIDRLWSLPLASLVAAALALAALLYAPRSIVQAGWMALSLLLFTAAVLDLPALHPLTTAAGLRHPPKAGTIYEDESQYSYISIVEDPQDPNFREMILDKLTHSRIDLRDATLLKYEYEWIYEAALDKFYPERRPVVAMIIGGGGFAFPRYLEVARPGSYVEASEIDPAVTEAAHAAFALPRDTTIHKFDMDARNRVADLVRQKAAGAEVPVFDCILGDSINDYTVPRHLTTIEFARQVDSLLAPDGLYMLNLIDLYDSGLFLGSVLATLREVFPQVEAFNTGRPASTRDTFVVVCSKVERDLSDLAQRIKERHDYVGGVIDQEALLARLKPAILTDDYAPVELMLRPVVHSRQRDRGQLLYFRALDLAEAGDAAAALALCEEAAVLYPAWPDLYEFKALLHERLDQPSERADALRKAITGHPNPPDAWTALGDALRAAGRNPESIDAYSQAAGMALQHLPSRVALGRAALQDGRADLALRAWQEASVLDPGSVTVWYNLGLTLAQSTRYNEAIDAWRRSLAIDPGFMDSYHNLALAYHLTKQPELARQTIEQMRARGGTPDPQLEAELNRQTP